MRLYMIDCNENENNNQKYIKQLIDLVDMNTNIQNIACLGKIRLNWKNALLIKKSVYLNSLF